MGKIIAWFVKSFLGDFLWGVIRRVFVRRAKALPFEFLVERALSKIGAWSLRSLAKNTGNIFTEKDAEDIIHEIRVRAEDEHHSLPELK